ncbi:alpha/beta hydrolases superfamily protein [Tanacetum coccineum]
MAVIGMIFNGLGLGLQSLHSLCQLHTNGLLNLIEGPFGLHSLHKYTVGLSRPIRWVKIASNSFLQVSATALTAVSLYCTIFVRQPQNYKKTFQRSFDDKNGKNDRKCLRCGDPNHLIGECPKPPKDKNQRAFVRGSWNDSGEEDDEKAKTKYVL